MYNRLVTYINENRLLYKYQFGLREGKATYMALIVLIEKMTDVLDKSESVIAVLSCNIAVLSCNISCNIIS